MLLPPLYHHCASFGRPVASIERPRWRPVCLHSATTATLQPPWQCFCLHSASFARPVVQLQQFWWFKERIGVVLQLTQKQNVLGLGDHWASWSIFRSLKGGTKAGRGRGGGGGGGGGCLARYEGHYSALCGVISNIIPGRSWSYIKAWPVQTQNQQTPDRRSCVPRYRSSGQ